MLELLTAEARWILDQGVIKAERPSAADLRRYSAEAALQAVGPSWSICHDLTGAVQLRALQQPAAELTDFPAVAFCRALRKKMRLAQKRLKWQTRYVNSYHE